MLSENRYDGLDPSAVQIGRKAARRLAGRFGMPRDERQDLEQEFILAAWTSLKRFDPSRGTKEALFTRVVRNRWRNIIRRQTAECRDFRRFGGSFQDPVQGEPGSEPTERGEVFDVSEYLRLTRGEPDPESQADLALDLANAIRPLPPDLQAICALLAQGYNRIEIARQLGISRSTFYDRRDEIARWLFEAGMQDYVKEGPDTSRSRPVGGQ